MANDRNVDTDDTEALRRAAITVGDLRERLSKAGSAEPVPRSVADADSLSAFGGLPIVFSHQALLLAEDHLLALHAILSQARVVPIFAHMTLMRSILEASARCRWLIDRRVSSGERRHRGAICQAEAYEEQRKFHETNSASESVASVRATSKDFQKRMLAAGWNPSSRVVTTNIFDSHGPGQWAWRLTSGFAHGSEWAMLSGDRFETAVVESGVRHGQTSVEIGANITHTVAIVEIARIYVVATAEDFESYCGPPSA